MCLTWNKQCMAFDNEVKRSNGDWESFRVSAWWWKDEHFARQLVNSPATPITLWYLEGLFCRPKIQSLHIRICVIGVNHESRAIFRSDLLVYIHWHQSSHSGWDRRERDVYALLLQLLGKKLQRCISLFWMPSTNKETWVMQLWCWWYLVLWVDGSNQSDTDSDRQSAQQISATHHWGGSPQSFCWLVKVPVTFLASTSLSRNVIYMQNFRQLKKVVIL